MWRDAALGTIARDDLAPGIFTFDRATHLTAATSTPFPGHAFYSQAEALLYIFHDEVEGTGVSLWLAIGPDRFDVACVAAEPIPAGAIVEPLIDKYVRVATEASNHAAAISMGANQAGIDFDDVSNPTTAASGAWIPVAVDGNIWAYANDTTLDFNRFCRVSATHPGVITRSSPGGGFKPEIDDPIGFTYQTVAAGATPINTRILWTGHRLYRALV